VAYGVTRLQRDAVCASVEPPTQGKRVGWTAAMALLVITVLVCPQQLLHAPPVLSEASADGSCGTPQTDQPRLTP
jgi:hypothetical protein